MYILYTLYVYSPALYRGHHRKRNIKYVKDKKQHQIDVFKRQKARLTREMEQKHGVIQGVLNITLIIGSWAGSCVVY